MGDYRGGKEKALLAPFSGVFDLNKPFILVQGRTDLKISTGSFKKRVPFSRGVFAFSGEIPSPPNSLPPPKDRSRQTFGVVDYR